MSDSVSNVQAAENPFFLMMKMYLKDVETQGQGVEGGLESELVLRNNLQLLNEQVKEKEKALAALEKNVGSSKVSVGAVQAALTEFQAVQTLANSMQNAMTKCFKESIDPCQQMQQQDEAMFGEAVRLNALTLRTA